MKIALCGPPQSGKSCLRDGLKTALRRFERLGKAPYPYFITACPDGEGAWYSETARQDPVLARRLKEAYKSKFTWEFTERVAASVRDVPNPLTLIDMGGKIDDKNRLILSHATHAIILSGKPELIPAWVDFCQELNINILAILRSDQEATSDVLEAREPILRGTIHYLARGEDVSDRPMILELADLLVRMGK